jgi:hypothetical protein
MGRGGLASNRGVREGAHAPVGRTSGQVAHEDHFNHRHFARGGYPYYYANDCSWLRSYSWARYEACVGIY